jgi:predicted HTH transcriptional regulator
MNQYIEWKWSKGLNHDRSKRINSKSMDDNFNKIVEDTAYTTSLNHDENTWEILNNNIFDKDFVQHNKREDTDKKLSERQMMCQVNMNPYLTNNSYVQDLSVHDQFMKPVSTNSELDSSNSTNSSYYNS